MEQPPIGWTTPVEIVKVVDGDTIRVKITKEFDIRLTDDAGTFDTPETWRPENEEERKLGQKATSFLYKLLFMFNAKLDDGIGRYVQKDDIVLHIPADERGRIKDIFSIGARVVGRLFVGGKDVTEEMTNAGHNTKDPK